MTPVTNKFGGVYRKVVRNILLLKTGSIRLKRPDFRSFLGLHFVRTMLWLTAGVKGDLHFLEISG
jgi:hypothetical protein